MKAEEDKEANKSAMKISSVAALIIVILLCSVSSVTAAELQVHEGESIQAVINMAKPGDTIIVHNGTYTENVVVNRSNITLRSANGSAVTIVESNRTDVHVFNITDQKNVTLEGFTIRDASAALNMTRNDKINSQAISALLLPPEYQRGSIRITSKPSHARIYLVTPNGPILGQDSYTPYTWTGIAIGTSTITLSLAGYYDWKKNVQVRVGETTAVHATLTPKPTPTPTPPAKGAISVSSSPSGARATIDGYSWVGSTPCKTRSDLPPGTYTLRLSLAGYQGWTKSVRVTAGKTAHIDATLTPISGSIRITSTPSGANVYMDNKYKGKTPNTITGLSPDYYTIKLTLAGYQDWTKKIHVAAGETAQIHGTLSQATGTISVTSVPSDAKIYLDDRYRGKTPHRVTEVSPDYHTLRLTLDGYLDWSTNLQVRAGETSDVAAIMIPSVTQAGIYMNNASNCAIKNNRIINCGQGLLIASGCSNIIEENIIRNDTIAGAGVRIESSATNTGIHENCFIDNVPHAWDDGTDNNWIGNYWSPPPGGQGNYIIPGAAESEDKDPLDECILTGQQT